MSKLRFKKNYQGYKNIIAVSSDRIVVAEIKRMQFAPDGKNPWLFEGGFDSDELDQISSFLRKLNKKTAYARTPKVRAVSKKLKELNKKWQVERTT